LFLHIERGGDALDFSADPGLKLPERA